MTVAGPAGAQGATDAVVGDYVASGGRIDPCKHSSATLRAALGEVTSDIEQYGSDYPNAIKAAIAARARGDCDGKKTPPPAVVVPPPVVVVPTPIPTPVPTAIPTKTVVPEPPAPLIAPVSTPSATQTAPEDVRLEQVSAFTPDNDAPAPFVLLLALAAVLATAALFLATMRRLGLGDDRLAPARHAWREASWRAEGMWGDFRDWLKLGR